MNELFRLFVHLMSMLNCSTVRKLSFYTTVLTGNWLCAGCWCWCIMLLFLLLEWNIHHFVKACSCSCLFTSPAYTLTCRQRFIPVIPNDFENSKKKKKIVFIWWNDYEWDRETDGRMDGRRNGWFECFFSPHIGIVACECNYVSSWNKLVRTAPSVNAECISCVWIHHIFRMCGNWNAWKMIKTFTVIAVHCTLHSRAYTNS